jgi:hypothetical protein
MQCSLSHRCRQAVLSVLGLTAWFRCTTWIVLLVGLRKAVSARSVLPVFAPGAAVAVGWERAGCGTIRKWLKKAREHCPENSLPAAPYSQNLSQAVSASL